MRGRLLVVSHASVLPVNQPVYARLVELGWDVRLVVPARWRHDYAEATFTAAALPGLEERLTALPVSLAGRPQRHFYSRVRPTIRAVAPEVAFLEEETFSVAAWQWGRALRRAGVPFGVQAAENLERPLPAIARLLERRALDRSSFVAARSVTAAERARRHGAQGVVGLAPHAVPGWERPEGAGRNGAFTVGYAGRLVPEKGLADLAAAVARLGAGTRLLLVGDGPLRAGLQRAPAVEVLTGVAHDDMAAAFARMDVLVLPSRTTSRWAEQFGRVLVEALWCGVPVVGSDSGEIPWVIETTGGGLVFPEGDVAALTAALATLRESPGRRRELAETGRAAVEAYFSVAAAAAALDELLLGSVGGR